VDHSEAQPGELVEVTHAPGRGALIPLAVFRKVGLYDRKRLPHYGADYDLTLRARRAGFKVYISFDAKLYSHVEKTGATQFRGKRTLRGLFDYLTNMKSPASLRYRWRFALNNCPKILLPTYILLDTVFVIGSYIRNAR
jgi:GT2 family glycosyltransferase